MSVSGPQHCCIILVSLQLTCRVRYSKNIIHAVRITDYHWVCMDENTNTHIVYRFDTQQFNKCLVYFWVSLKMKTTRYVLQELWYTWYIFQCLRRKWGACYMHCTFLGISDKEKHMFQWSQLVYQYIFGLKKKKKTWDNTCYMFGFFWRKNKKERSTSNKKKTKRKTCHTTRYVLGYLWKRERCGILPDTEYISGNICKKDHKSH